MAVPVLVCNENGTLRMKLQSEDTAYVPTTAVLGWSSWKRGWSHLCGHLSGQTLAELGPSLELQGTALDRSMAKSNSPNSSVRLIHPPHEQSLLFFQECLQRPHLQPPGILAPTTSAWNSRHKACWGGRLWKWLASKTPRDCT